MVVRPFIGDDELQAIQTLVRESSLRFHAAAAALRGAPYPFPVGGGE
jgi:hypothetical protein